MASSAMKQWRAHQMECAIQWGRDNFRVSSPVSAMVQIAGIPERTFKREFTALAGKAPLEWIHELRIECATSLVIGTKWKISKIADFVGYADTGFFCRLFKRKHQFAPAEFRRYSKRLVNEPRTQDQSA